jgi:hypothetical protein
VLTGGEEFTVKTVPGQDLLLVTRVHGRTSVPLAVTANGQQLEQRVQPAVPGQWLEVVTWVPKELVTGTRTRIRIVPRISNPKTDAYSPYYHWAYEGAFVPEENSTAAPVASFRGYSPIELLDDEIVQHSGQLEVKLTWRDNPLAPATADSGNARRNEDGIVFVHLYNRTNAQPVAQIDRRPEGGVLPPGNWLPGIIHDSYTLDLSNVPPGTYTVAIGLYDAVTKTRYHVSGSEFDPLTGQGVDADRLFIGKITVEESAP